MTLNQAAYHLLRETGRKADDALALAHAKFFIKYRRAYYVRQDVEKRQGYIFQQTLNLALNPVIGNTMATAHPELLLKGVTVPMPLQFKTGPTFHYVGTADGCKSFDWIPFPSALNIIKYSRKGYTPKYSFSAGRLLVFNYMGDMITVVGTFSDPIAVMNLQKGSENCFNDDEDFLLPDNMFHYIIEEAKVTKDLLTKTVNTDGNI